MLDVFSKQAFTKACFAADWNRLSATDRGSPVILSHSTLLKEHTALAYMANINDSVALGTSSRFPIALSMVCCTLGAWSSFVNGFTLSRNACHNLKP